MNHKNPRHAPHIGGTENHDFVRACDIRQLQVLGELRVSAGIGEDGEAGGNEDDGEGGKAVKAVGQVDGVGSTNDGQIGQDDKADYAQRQGDLFEEGNDQDVVGAIGRKVKQGKRGNNGDARLPHL